MLFAVVALTVSTSISNSTYLEEYLAIKEALIWLVEISSLLKERLFQFLWWKRFR